MKTLALLLALALSGFVAQAQESTGITITVTINNAQNDNGFMLLGLHTQETFMKGKGTQSVKEKITDGKIQVTFKNVPEGDFAIMVLHDENENNRMDFDINGMPKEAYGLSNNEMLYGPPNFEDAKFTVKDQNLDLEIRL